MFEFGKGSKIQTNKTWTIRKFIEHVEKIKQRNRQNKGEPFVVTEVQNIPKNRLENIQNKTIEDIRPRPEGRVAVR